MANQAISAVTERSVPELDDFTVWVDNGVTTRYRLSATRLLGMLGLLPGGRLTVESGKPVSPLDKTAQGTIYYTPFLHDRIRAYDGTRWVYKTFVESSLALTVTSGIIYDVFLDDDASTLSLGTAWTGNGMALTGATNATPIVITANSHGLQNGDEVYIFGVGGNPAANGTWIVANKATNTFELTGSVGSGAYTSGGWFNARAAAGLLGTQDSIPVLASDHTKLHLGTVLASGSNVIENSAAKRYLWNRYNRVMHRVQKAENSSHTINNQAIREWNGGTAARAQFVIGDSNVGDFAFNSETNFQTAGAAFVVTGPCINQITSIAAGMIRFGTAGSSSDHRLCAVGRSNVIPGLNFVTVFEQEAAAVNATMSGTNARGEIEC